MERLAVVAITKDGMHTAMKLAGKLHRPVDIFISRRLTDLLFEEHSESTAGFSFEIMEEGFFREAERIYRSYKEIVLLMACGIAVRSFGPLATDKKVDPAVVVADERGRNIISFLSGHLGGGNRLTREIAEALMGNPIITTASDLKGFYAVDTLAEKMDWFMTDVHEAGHVTAELVDQEKVGILASAEAFAYNTDEAIAEMIQGGYQVFSADHGEDLRHLKGLVFVGWEKTKEYEAFHGSKTWLIPKDLILGFGCRKEAKSETIERVIEKILFEQKLSINRVSGIYTIGIKSVEPGLRDFARKHRIDIHVVPEEEILRVEHLFHGSEFVRQTVGVGSVAEPCAYIGSGKGKQILARQAEDGVTLAIYEKEKPWMIGVNKNEIR